MTCECDQTLRAGTRGLRIALRPLDCGEPPDDIEEATATIYAEGPGGVQEHPASIEDGYIVYGPPDSDLVPVPGIYYFWGRLEWPDGRSVPTAKVRRTVE